MKKSDLLRNVRQALGFRPKDRFPESPTAPGSPPAKQAMTLEARISPSGGVIMRIPIDPDDLTELVPPNVVNYRSLSEANGDGA